MKLSAGDVFLRWTAFFGLLAVADPSPGILVRLSEDGIQEAAESVVEWLGRRINQGMRVPDQSGSVSPFLGDIEYFLTEIEVRKFTSSKLTVTINPGAGMTATFGEMKASTGGKFSYKYTLMYIPTWNSGTFDLTIRDVSLSVEATAGMSPDGQPTFDIRSCSASVGNIDLTFQANIANWFVNLFTDTVKDKIKPSLTDAICDAIRNGRNLIATEFAKNIEPCIDSTCNCLIDLRLASPPVFGKNFIETSHRGEIFCKNHSSRAPFEALPFQRLPWSSKMMDLYVNAHVLNTLMYAMHQNDLLSYKFSKNDLPDKYRNILDTSCENKSICIGNIFPESFAPYPNAFAELEFAAISAPFMNISNTNFAITFNYHAKIQIRKSNGPLIAEKVLTLRGSVAGSVFINPDGLIEFTVTDIRLANASISSHNETETDLFTGEDLDVVSRLLDAVKENLLPRINEFVQRSVSITTVGRFRLINRSIKLTQNAFVFTTNLFYSKA